MDDSDIEALFRQLAEADEWSDRVEAADELGANGGAAIVARLVALLDSPTWHTREAAALALRNISDDTAISPLCAAVRDPRFIGRSGTMVYALQTHDCSHILRFLFSLALDPDGTYEVQHHALTILSEQQFWYTLDDLEAMHLELAAYARRTERDEWTDTIIRILRGLLDDLQPSDEDKD